MTNIMAEAVEAIEKKLDGSVFDGSAKFAIEDEGDVNEVQNKSIILTYIFNQLWPYSYK